MNGCETHGHLVAGYVLGALEPTEAEDMRKHFATCDQCSRERAALAGIPALLDRIEPTDVPPPVPPPGLEEAVLDRVAREAAAQRTPEPRRRRLAVPALAGAAAALAAVALAVVLLRDGGDDPYAHGSLRGEVGASASFVVHEVGGGSRVRLEAAGLHRGGAPYELWCIRKDGRWVSGGTFHARSDGRADADLTAAVGPGEYHKVVVTRRHGGGRGYPVMRGKLEY